jgi:glycosyltransferase involved in cell wall biosynthesis
MKILWHSNSPMVPTGYGNQTALFAPRLRDAGYEVALSAFYGLEGAPIMWENIPVFPSLGGEFGNQYIAGHAAAFFGGDPKAGIVMTLMDVLALSTDVYKGLNTVCWTPVDHEPATPTQKHFFSETPSIPIAMSRYGQDQLSEFNPYYVPHGIDTDVFMPLNKKAVRAEVGIGEDEFIVGMVAANKGNPSRKCFVEALSAFARLRAKHENVTLYLHTEISGSVSGGIPIGEVLNALGVPPAAVARADQYRLLFSPYPAREMAAIYSSFDVLLAPSAGEGFGIPLAEAQACGVPVITTDFSASKEVVGSGWHVGGQKMWTGQRSWQMTPNVDEISEALEECYNLDSKQRGAYRRRAREHAMQYDLAHVTNEHMIPALEDIEAKLADRPKIEVAS